MLGVAIPTQIQRAGAAIGRTLNYANYAWDFVSPMLPRLSGDRGAAQVVVNGLTVRCEQTLDDDRDFSTAWEDLYQRSPHATPFQSPAWQRAILDSPEASRRLRLFSARAGGKLVTMLPLQSRGVTVLRSAGAMLGDYLDPLVDPEYAQLAWPALLQAVRELQPGRTLVLENLREETISKPDLESFANDAGFQVEAEQQTVSRIALRPTWEAYLASLGSHQRKELRRKLSKAETQAGAVLQSCADPESINIHLNGTIALFEGSGGGKARKAKWLFPRHFAACAPQLAASGRLVLHKLFLEDRLAAALIGLPTASGQILWNTAYDPAFKLWSPGIVLFAMVIRRSIEQGHKSIDLLRGQNDYKSRLGATEYALHSLTLRPMT